MKSILSEFSIAFTRKDARELDITELSRAFIGETTELCVDREKLLETANEELLMKRDLEQLDPRLPLRILFRNESKHTFTLTCSNNPCGQVRGQKAGRIAS